MTAKFTVTPKQRDLIIQIAKRAKKEVFALIERQSEQDIQMDLMATVAQGCDLDLERLLNFDAFNFAHDLLGIWRHIDRDTGLLGDHFLPRCAR